MNQTPSFRAGLWLNRSFQVKDSIKSATANIYGNDNFQNYKVNILFMDKQSYGAIVQCVLHLFFFQKN